MAGDNTDMVGGINFGFFGHNVSIGLRPLDSSTAPDYAVVLLGLVGLLAVRYFGWRFRVMGEQLEQLQERIAELQIAQGQGEAPPRAP